MPINQNELAVNGIYVTETDQLRKVTSITAGKVQYQAKSAKIPHRPWEWAATKTNPPSLDTFCGAVDRRLTSGEIEDLIKDDVLTTEDR